MRCAQSAGTLGKHAVTAKSSVMCRAWRACGGAVYRRWNLLSTLYLQCTSKEGERAKRRAASAPCTLKRDRACGAACRGRPWGARSGSLWRPRASRSWASCPRSCARGGPAAACRHEQGACHGVPWLALRARLPALLGRQATSSVCQRLHAGTGRPPAMACPCWRCVQGCPHCWAGRPQAVLQRMEAGAGLLWRCRYV